MEIGEKLQMIEKLDLCRTFPVNDAVIGKCIFVFPSFTDISIPYTGITSQALFEIEK